MRLAVIRELSSAATPSCTPVLHPDAGLRATCHGPGQGGGPRRCFLFLPFTEFSECHLQQLLFPPGPSLSPWLVAFPVPQWDLGFWETPGSAGLDLADSSKVLVAVLRCGGLYSRQGSRGGSLAAKAVALRWHWGTSIGNRLGLGRDEVGVQ